MSRLPDPFPSLLKRIRAIEELQRRMGNASPFFGTGFHCTADNGIASDNFDGNLNAGNAGTKGWAMDADQAAFGELILRPGSVGNASLTNPVAPGVVWSDLHNFSLSTTLTNKLTATITVPAGFTTAAVSVVGRTYVINGNTTGGYDSAGGDYIYAQTNIAGFNGNTLPLAVSGSGGSGAAISPFSAVLTGLTPGGTFTVQMAASTSFAAIAANASNTIELSGSLLWFR